jgi:hypothetical protein
MKTESKVWPNGMPKVGQKAQDRVVTARDIELFTETKDPSALR